MPSSTHYRSFLRWSSGQINWLVQICSLTFTAWSSVHLIRLFTPNNLGGTWRCICSPDIQSISVSEVLRNHALQIDIYLLTYLPMNHLADTIKPNLNATKLQHKKMKNSYK